ncbi:MAG: acylneuraminate cytidylyltransferase [bacterium]|nr:acylneuraminate cytidylyltransferase [bacterium]
MQDKKIVAIIPIKLNNARFPGKNTKILGGRPLIKYVLSYLQQVNEIDEIYVYCSNPSIKPFLKEGIHFLERPKSLDEPTSNFTQIFESFSSKVDADVYVYAHATAPYIKPSTIKQCIHNVTDNGYDSSFTAEKIQDFLWKDGQPLNFDAANVPRSQDINPIYRETSGVYVFTKQVFKTYHRRIGAMPCPVEVTKKEQTDINYPEDFQTAQLYFNYCE